MQRTKTKRNPDLILTADIHLRDDTPRCRTDDYWKAQSQKIRFIRDLQEKHQIPILDAGDLLDKWKSSPYLEGWAIDNLPDNIITVPGNHELPYHSVSRLDRSSLNVLYKAQKIDLLTDPINGWLDLSPIGIVYGFPFGIQPNNLNLISSDVKKIAICHILTYESQNLWPGMDSIDAASLIRKIRGFDLILTGHNHHSFTLRYGSQLLVNPGSMMRMAANQIDHEPRVYLWYVDSNEVEAVYLPIDKGVISRKHLDKQEQRNEKLEAYMESLSQQQEFTLDYVYNLRVHFEQNRIREPVRALIRESMGENLNLPL